MPNKNIAYPQAKSFMENAKNNANANLCIWRQ